MRLSSILLLASSYFVGFPSCSTKGLQKTTQVPSPVPKPILRTACPTSSPFHHLPWQHCWLRPPFGFCSMMKCTFWSPPSTWHLDCESS